MLRLVAGAARHLAGWKRDAPDPRDRSADAPVDPTALPQAVDLRQLCPPVFDQGHLGSCTANAGCAAFEFLQRQGKSDAIYSRLYLYLRTRQLEGTLADDDAGAQIRDVFKALARWGVPLDATWPYDPAKFADEPPAAADAEAAQHRALFYYRCPDLDTVKHSLAQGFPVEFGFEVYESMMSDAVAASGLVPYPAAGEQQVGGHAVLAVGYDDAVVVGADRGAVLCQNSWSWQWGDGGFFWLPYRYFTDGLASDCWTLRKVGP